MMEVSVICFFVGILISVSESYKRYYFVTGPNVIRFDNPETFTVSIFGRQRDVPVEVWFEHGKNEKISHKTVTVPSEEKPQQTTVRVTKDDIFNSTVNKKPRHIKLCSKRDKDNKICRRLVLSYKTGYLIVQTDQPIYTPLKKVTVRVLALDESLKAISGDKWQVAVDIVSPSYLTLGRKTFTKTKPGGFYWNSFKLPRFPEMGMWTARAFYRGQVRFETVSRAIFQVEEYVLPTFGVSIDVSPPCILKNREEVISIVIKAKYVYGKPVQGRARLALNITDNIGNSKYLLGMNKQTLASGIQEFKIKTKDILESGELKSKEFPDGKRLLIVASVFESETGKEETSANDETVFASREFIFKFTKSRRYFRPWMEYYLKVQMFTANYKPATDKQIEVLQLNEFGQEIESGRKSATTNDKGKAIAIFSVLSTRTLKFKVRAQNDYGVQESEILEVTAYSGKNQIQVESVVKDNTMHMRATTNIPIDDSGKAQPGYTGILFMVVTRGKIVKTVFKPAGTQATEVIDEKLQKLINPTARLLVFFVDEGSDIVVADSIKLEDDPKCRGKGLTLTPSEKQTVPGDRGKLTIFGEPMMWVGLHAMDKATLLLNDENILKRNKLFNALASHDLGCGEGSGRNNGDVFKNSGLTVLTNARVESEVERIHEDCDETKRRKRAIDDCYGANKVCCDYGKWYARHVFDEMKTEAKKVKIDPYTKCYGTAVSHRTSNVRIQCLLGVFYSCMEVLDSLISEITQLLSKSFDDVSQFASDLVQREINKVNPHRGTDFREAFLFDEEDQVQLDIDGKDDKLYIYPDSITEWMIQGIGVSENEGVCMSESVDVRVYRDFFVQLDLPYKARRLELVYVKVTLFNYGSEEKKANVYLEGVDGLCYNRLTGQKRVMKSLEISPNSANTFRFPMVPLKTGSFPIKITAVCTDMGIPLGDIIQKDLLVVNEGIQEIITIQVCLDPGEQAEECEDSPTRVKTVYGNADGIRKQISKVDLTLPKNAILGTGSASGYIQGNIMDNVVREVLSGVDSLFECPHGCGEQTIATTAPNVYVMMYLKQTDQETAEAEDIGNSNIREGVNREKTMFRHSDGSYSCCNNDKHTNKFRPTSVWLTAFVLKVFCHAHSVIDDAIDVEEDLYTTMKYLNNHVNDKGEFTEIIDMRSGSWLRGSGATGTSPSLTSFVLISLLECSLLQEEISRTVDTSMKYIETIDEQWLKSRPFDLAIATYALALTKSDKRETFKKWLISVKKTNGKNIYWAKSDIQAGDKADAYSVETTAYALLAILQFNDYETSAKIVRWLTSQQDIRGVFRSTQDTVVGLQALTEYSIRTFSPEVDLRVTMFADYWPAHEFILKQERFYLHVIENLPVESFHDQMTVKVTGTSGSGRMRVELRYNRPAKSDEFCPFELSDIEISSAYKIDPNIKNKRQCDVCGVCANDPEIADYDFLTTPEPDESDDVNDCNRRKRQAGRDVEKMKCVRFTVRSKQGHQHGMSMIYFNLETGVTVLEEDMKELMKRNENLDDYEMPSNGNGFIVFYLHTLNSNVNEFVFRLEDDFENDKNEKTYRQPVSVDVFDYYNPGKENQREAEKNCLRLPIHAEY